MITIIELRHISLDFRRKSSDLLNATYDTANIKLKRFKQYIDNTPFISDLIHKKIVGIDYDYNKCFTGDSLNGWRKIQIPTEESEHIKAMYDFMSDIIAKDESVIQIAMAFSYKKNITECVQNFYNDAFKPLIDYIVDEISKEMILREDEMKINSPSFTQNIQTMYGSANQQISGSIVTHTYFSSEVKMLLDEIEKMCSALGLMKGIDKKKVEDIRDDLEAILEQISCETPKKRRIEKALENIKIFIAEFSTQLAVTTTSGIIGEMEWCNLIEKIKLFLEMH